MRPELFGDLPQFELEVEDRLRLRRDRDTALLDTPESRRFHRYGVSGRRQCCEGVLASLVSDCLPPDQCTLVSQRILAAGAVALLGSSTRPRREP